MNIHMTGTLLCRDADEAKIVREALPEHVRLTRAEPGCLTFEVNPRAGDPSTFEVSECFVDREAFEAHQRRTRASEWFQLTRHIKRVYDIQGLCV